jgi:hypothetical protein
MEMPEYEVVEYQPQTRELALGSLPTSGPAALIQQASDIAKELAKIIRDRRLASRIQGKEFVHVEGWSTMGAMLGVLPREVSTKRLEDGSYEATVELIRINDGAIIGRASAICGVDEKDRNGNLTWANRPEYARRSMSVTRATGKAYRLGFSWIMALAGYEPTPAEEMIDTGDSNTTTRTTKPPKPTTKPSGNEGNGKEKGFSLSEEAMKAILDAKLAEHPANAARMVNLSSLLNKTSTTDEIIKWSAFYRAARDEGKERDVAAKQADQLAFEETAEGAA